MPSLCEKQDKFIASDASETTLKQCLTIVEKKVRNLEKRKTKLDSYQVKQVEGADLNKDQQDAVSKYEVVLQNLDFARDLHKQFQLMLQESEKLVRKQVRREKIERQHHEISRLRTLLRLNTVLAGLTHDHVKSDFLTGSHGANVLTEDSVEHLCILGRLVSAGDDLSDTNRLDGACDHILSFLDARDALVTGTTTTYQKLRDTLDAIVCSGYFSHPVRDVGCDTEKHEPEVNGHDLQVNGDAAADPQPEKSYSPSLSTTSNLSLPSSITTSPSDAHKPVSSTSEPSYVSAAVGQFPAVTVTPAVAVTTAPSLVAEEPFRFETASLSATDDLFYDRKKDAQDIVSALQGSFDFLQDSEIDEDRCYSMGYSTDVEIPCDTADAGYGMTNGYSSEYIVTNTVPNGVDMTQQYHNDLPTTDTSAHAPAMLTYANQYAPAAPMMTTVPYCAPLIADPYIVQHGVSYPHQVAYTTGYGAVMPAYSQPMMSAGQMPHDDVANQQPLNGHVDTGGEEYVGVVDTDYIGGEDYFSSDTFIAVTDAVSSHSPVDDCLNEEPQSDKPERTQLNPNANEFHSRFTDTPPPDGAGEFDDDRQQMNYRDREMGHGFRGGRGRGGRGWLRGGYYNGRGFHPRFRDNYRQDGYRNGDSGYNGSWRGPRRGFRGWGGFRGRNYDRNSQAVDDVTTNNRDEPN